MVESFGDLVGMLIGFCCMNCGNYWYVIELGKGDGWMGY